MKSNVVSIAENVGTLCVFINFISLMMLCVVCHSPWIWSISIFGANYFGLGVQNQI